MRDTDKSTEKLSHAALVQEVVADEMSLMFPERDYVFELDRDFMARTAGNSKRITLVPHESSWLANIDHS